jgi:hypothetical protein
MRGVSGRGRDRRRAARTAAPATPGARERARPVDAIFDDPAAEG